MGIAKDVIASNADYQSVLAAHPIVFMLFVSQTCPACTIAVELFEPIAESYEPTVKSLVLDAAKTPTLEQVTSVPTLVVHTNGNIKEILKGFGPRETQEQTLRDLFSRYAQQQAPGKSASPAAPPPSPPSGATLHAPGYRPQLAGDRADSSPDRPGSGNPRSPQP